VQDKAAEMYRGLEGRGHRAAQRLKPATLLRSKKKMEDDLYIEAALIFLRLCRAETAYSS
jgi:hypothetical protein